MKISVIAHPGAKRNIVRKEIDILTGEDVYHVFTSSKAVDGLANDAIIILLANFFNIKKYQIRLVSGQKGRKKIVKIMTILLYLHTFFG